MSEIEVLPAKPRDTEKAVRAIFRRHLRKLTRVLLTPECHAVMEEQITLLYYAVQYLRCEASLEKRSKEYEEFCKSLLTSTAEGQLGPLANLTESGLDALDKMFELLVSGLGGKQPGFDTLDPAAFISLQKAMLVRPKKRGPKFRPELDEAFALRMEGKSITQIAQAMEPEVFLDDPLKPMQKISKAIKRRERSRQ